VIAKARINEIAAQQALLVTTIEKDYVLGWLLSAVAGHDLMSRWIFKGGTCLKKCYFETYRFSEDLDFTIPRDLGISVDLIRTSLGEIAAWIEDRCGLTFPRGDIAVDEYRNPRGNPSYQAKVTFAGPLGLPRKSLQRVKFDLTQDELVARPPVHRAIHHVYGDAIEPAPGIRCYSVDELLAEKSRALVERFGRARDVYDVVNISRNFREVVRADEARAAAGEKFAFKGLEAPTTAGILSAVDQDVLRGNWEHQLGHQLPVLPDVQTFIEDLADAIAWWLEPARARPPLEPVPRAEGARVPRSPFPAVDWRTGQRPLDAIRYAARNRLCALVVYDGVERLVEPYSLRYPRTGNEVLHVWEVTKGGGRSESHKSFVTSRIQSARVSSVGFSPRWLVEL
jgi:predicted nucleotidyltransferase component of viral defense system